jgi:bifunctional non-homologous end joining protein LigD
MLSRPAKTPPTGEYAHEVKWDGFRAIVSTVDGLRVRSRRGWNMTPLLPEFEQLPAGLVLDGELVAFRDGRPHFRSCANGTARRRHDPARLRRL